MQVERTYGKRVYLRPRTSEKDEFEITAPTRILKNHPIENVIGELTEGRKTKYKLELKEAPMTWYERLTNLLIENATRKGE